MTRDIDYFDFEFEQYTLDRKILRELIMDEIILYHSEEARNYHKQCKVKYPKGILETIYQRVGGEKELNTSNGQKSADDVETCPSSENRSPEQDQT